MTYSNHSIWTSALQRGAQVGDNSVIYKGIKFTRTPEGLDFLTTETDFYEKMEGGHVENFYEMEFEMAVSAYLFDKYSRQIELVGSYIKDEWTHRKNRRKYEYLKKLRTNIIKKLSDERRNRQVKG